jgi:hypothetical protein
VDDVGLGVGEGVGEGLGEVGDGVGEGDFEGEGVGEGDLCRAASSMPERSVRGAVRKSYTAQSAIQTVARPVIYAVDPFQRYM